MKILFTLIAVAGVLLGAGKIFVWSDSVVGYGSYVPWGLWVAVYSFMVTLAGGAALVANLYYGFGKDKYKDTARRSLLLAMVTLIFALPLIGLDLGHPFRGIRVLIAPDFQAFLPWAVWSYVLFLIFSYAVIKKADRGGNTRGMGKLSMLFAAAFLFFEAMHFGTVVAHPVWNSAVTVPLFFATAVALGFCVSALLSKEITFGLRVLIIAHLVMVGLIEIGMVGVEAYSGTPAMAASVAHTVSSPMFWAYILFGLVLPVAIFSGKPSRTTAAVGVWSAFLGLLAAKYEFITSAFALAQFAELPQAYHGPGLTVHYIPTAIELGVALGFISAAIAAYLWLLPQQREASS